MTPSRHPPLDSPRPDVRHPTLRHPLRTFRRIALATKAPKGGEHGPGLGGNCRHGVEPWWGPWHARTAPGQPWTFTSLRCNNEERWMTR